LGDDREFGVVLIRNGREVGGPAEPHTVGTSATIAGYARLPDGRYLLEVEGTRRFHVYSMSSNGTYPSALVEWLSEPIGNFAQARRASLEVDRLFGTYRARRGDGDLPVRLPIDPVSRSYLVASLLRIDPYEKQQLLELDSAEERLTAEAGILRREITVLDHLRAKRG
jgi:Lon protease-like protein